jgi:opacity protein-like surface antigen
LYALAVIVTIAAGPAYAQRETPRPERPYRGLFGSSPGDLNQQLTVNGSLGVGFDDNVLADLFDQTSPTFGDLTTSHRGGVGTASAGIGYLLNRQRVTAVLSGETTGRYYPTLTPSFIRRNYASGTVGVNIGKGLSAGAQGVYEPYSVQTMFPVLVDVRGGVPAIDEDFASSTEHYIAYSSNVAYRHQLSRRTFVGLDAAYHVREGSALVPRFTYTDAGGGLTHNLTKDLSLRLGYRYATAQYGDVNNRSRPVDHVIDAGVDYKRALSRSRRTNVAFSTGASAATGRPGYETRLRAIGSADLTHEIGRTWLISVGYYRGVDYVESWPEPVFADTVTTGVNGLITRRVEFHASARAASGTGEFSSKGDLRTYYGNAGVSYAVTRFISTGVTYAYYNHRFADSVLLAPGFPHHVNRESVRVYISLWAPLFERSRRPQ